MASNGALRREYRTIALPQDLRGKRRWGRSQAEAIAAAVGEIINREAAGGWTYLRSDEVRAHERVGLLGGYREVSHTILVFERPRGAEPAFEEEPEMRGAPEPRSASRREPREPREHGSREAREPGMREQPRMREPSGRGRADQEPGFDEPPARAEREPASRGEREGGARRRPRQSARGSADQGRYAEPDMREPEVGRGRERGGDRRAASGRGAGYDDDYRTAGLRDQDPGMSDEDEPRYRGLVETMVHTRSRRDGD